MYPVVLFTISWLVVVVGAKSINRKPVVLAVKELTPVLLLVMSRKEAVEEE